MLDLGLKLLIAYGLGSIVGALLVGQFRGVDIRSLGSGNAGGTNALRTQGLAFAAATVVIDVGKGWFATAWLPGLALAPAAGAGALAPAALTPACGLAAILGHVFPLWHEFRGGKGGATLVGALLALSPLLLAVALVAWLAVVAVSGFVGLATVAGAATVPVAAALLGSGPAPVTFAAAAALVALAHRGNLARIRAGTEPRAESLWLFGRRRGRP